MIFTLALASLTGLSSTHDWQTLDMELTTLAQAAPQAGNAGAGVSGWVQVSARLQEDGVDTNADTVGDADELGFLVDQVRLHFQGKVTPDTEYKIGVDILTSTTDLQDAYIRWTLAEGQTLTAGRFLRPGFKSGMLPKLKLFFLQRTRIGALMYRHDLGALGGMKLGPALVQAAISNGDDDQQEDLAYTLAVGADLLGKGAGSVEGGWGAAEGTNLYGSVFAFDDGSFDDGAAFGAESHLTTQGFTVSAELASFGDELNYNPNPKQVGEEGSTPWGVTLSYLFAERWEAAVRYEDYDDAENRTRWTAGANHYLAGHNLKWTLQYLATDSDSPTEPEAEYALGATLGF
jgi:hypothetical protein